MNNDKLDALFDGLTGSTQSVQGKDEQPSKVKAKVTQTKSVKAKGERFCTIVNAETVKKIRLIAIREGLQIKDIVNAAFDKAIKSYERKNGAIDKDTRRDASQLF